MRRFNPFNLPANDDRQPWEHCLEATLKLDIQPGDKLFQNDLSKYMLMVPLEQISAVDGKEWAMRRWPQIDRWREEFESATGLILKPDHNGAYDVLRPDEVAEYGLGIMVSGVRRLKNKVDGILRRASDKGITESERGKRQVVRDFSAELYEYTTRRRRTSLSDVEEESSA